MGLLDWLLTDPTQGDGGFLARLLLDRRAGGPTAIPWAGDAGGSLLGESPLINLLRSGFAGLNAANGYAGFGSQFAAGMKGGADAMAQRRQQIVDQMNALKLRQALQAQAAMTSEGDGDADSSAVPASKPCAACAGRDRDRPAGAPGGDAGLDMSAAQAAGLPRVANEAEYEALPGGSRFIDSLGQIRVKP